ncbi:ribose 5-phosphate isomerase B [Pedobacter chinensis]|uniref:Ribose 5-phosphate isomerase B n=1 Tax=Pedobacter chinensis TaxID=2282421 RepID=A0A369PVU9_9SPHI|nr:ribose 5-phosphate isomerase B [Pedobacter chinensis]RDC54819.1 ribose 5-phosphate isomerase B [Pedobacter chinensis]
MPETRIKIAIGGDHAGFEYKEVLKNFLKDYEVKDFGTYSLDSVDYPDFAHPVASAVENGEFTYGILLCGSANGVAITANKHGGIRAGLCWESEVASLVRKHNDANVLCIPARFVSEELAKEITTVFLNTEFEGGRHQTRVEKISC